MIESFSEWLTEQLNRRGWSHNELARRAGVSQPAVSGIIAGRRPSADFCVKVAQALGEPPETAFRRAGYLPILERPEGVREEIIGHLQGLREEQLLELLMFIRFMKARDE